MREKVYKYQRLYLQELQKMVKKLETLVTLSAKWVFTDYNWHFYSFSKDVSEKVKGIGLNNREETEPLRSEKKAQWTTKIKLVRASRGQQ